MRVLRNVVHPWLLNILILHNLLNAERDLDCVEAFAGVGSIASAFIDGGYAAATFDRATVSADHNVLAYTGLVILLGLICRIRAGGLLWLAPPCGLWGFMSSSVHRRCKTAPWGNESNAGVREANAICCIVFSLVRLAWARNIRVIIEQPDRSHLYDIPALQSTMTLCGFQSVVTWMGSFGLFCPKPMNLRGDARFLGALRRDKPAASMLGPAPDGPAYVVDIEGRVSGTRALASTGNYTNDFGQAVLQAYVRSLPAIRNEVARTDADANPCPDQPMFGPEDDDAFSRFYMIPGNM